MFKKITFIAGILTILHSQTTIAHELDGAWHLRVMDGMEVRKARAILDFNMEKMKLSGFDACNRIEGTLIQQVENNTSIPLLKSTRMACRQHIHSWVSKRLHEVFKDGFSIKKEKKYGIEGMTLKSPRHELFLKRMQKE